MSDFLPPNYTVPQSGGNYYKLVQGENRLRILAGFSDGAVMGLEYWNTENKPVRHRMGEQFTLENAKDGSSPKHFWAMPVYDYKEGKVKVFEITQKSLQKSLSELSKDEDWGNPTGYDIAISRSGEGIETEYGLVPKPKKALPKEALVAWEEAKSNNLNLGDLFDGGDPFQANVSSQESTVDTDEEINIDDIEI